MKPESSTPPPVVKSGAHGPRAFFAMTNGHNDIIITRTLRNGPAGPNPTVDAWIQLFAHL